jgi:murein L,D-transpeptidase YcbB/YkuD
MGRLAGGVGSIVALALAHLVFTLVACRRAEQAPTAGSPPPASARGSLLAEPAGPPASDVAATIATVLDGARHPSLTWPDIPDVAPALRAIYEDEPDGLFWFAGDPPYPSLGPALEALRQAHAQGLVPGDYDAEALAKAWRAHQSGTPLKGPDKALFDLAVSVGTLRLLSSVQHGRVDPATLRWGYDLRPKRLDPEASLREARTRGVPAMIDALEPPFSHYDRARKALADYRGRTAAGEPAPVPDLPRGVTKIEPGTPWSGAQKLAARLRAFGDLDECPAGTACATDGPTLYAGPLAEAVKGFQRRHGLEADGVIGRQTIHSLNLTLAHRVRQIELAMERMRWLPEMRDRPTVFVNVPFFRLWATDPESGEEPLRMNVVVGKSLAHETPIFIGTMEYVVFRPYWNPPHSITVKEIVPHARRDPSYFARESLEIVASGDESAPELPATPENLHEVVAGRLHVRQKPGPMNSLGLAKFIFPNAENVYMHGTPARQLFSRARRDFSHGCIRLEDPARLAAWVLRDQPEWTRERIVQAMEGERPVRANLREPLTVVLFYDTVHVNSEGVVFFVDDIYGDDRQLDGALRQGYPYPTES